MSKAVIRFLVVTLTTVLAVALGYMAFLAVDVNRRTVQTVNVSPSTAEVGFTLDAMIFNREALVLKERGQLCHVLVEDGEKVGRGENFAVCFSSEKDLQSYVELEELRERLGIVGLAQRSETDVAALRRINSELIGVSGGLSSASGQGGILETGKEAELLELMLSRELCLGNSEKVDRLSDTLEAKVSAGEQQAGTGKYITAEKSGYFSGLADGWEQVISLDKLLDFSFEEYAAAMKAGPLSIDTDRVVGKMIYGYTWYLCAVTDADTAGHIGLGRDLDVIVSGEERSMEVLSKEFSPDGTEVLITFECHVPLSDISVEREQRVTVVSETYEGFRVPSEAIRVEDGVTGVYVLEGIRAEFKPVDIVYIGQDYYLVAGSDSDRDELFTNDAVIVGGKGLYDGKVVG